jgi:CRP/FNR family transcriptional regulator, anaerobic regulatory protein
MSIRQTKPADLGEVVAGGDGLLGKLLGSLPPRDREELLSHAKLRDVTAGTIVLEEGAVSDEIGYVIEGTLAMTQVIDPARSHIIGLLVATDLFGRLFDGPCSFRIQALSPARILSFPRGPLERVLRQHPDTERLFLVHLLDEMDAAREWLLLISGRRVLNRVASFLTILVRRSKRAQDGPPLCLRLPLARKDLAHYLGARPESLSRAFHELQNRGILRLITPYLFEVLDPQALAEASGDDLRIDTRATGQNDD